MAKDRCSGWRGAAFRLAGISVLGLCLLYLVRELSELDLARLVGSMHLRAWLATCVAAVVYAACLGLLAQAWVVIAAPGRKLSAMKALAAYGPGTVAKYLPGSVFQYASRHVIGMRLSMDNASMAKASLFEAGLHVGIAIGLAIPLIAGGGWLVLTTCALIAAALSIRPSSSLVLAFALQLLFFCAFAAIVTVIGTLGALTDDPARLTGFFLVAWVAGFLVPIAPGGIGVREAALLALAAPYETTDAIVLVALLARLVGIVGDGLFGLAGCLAATRLNRQASA